MGKQKRSIPILPGPIIETHCHLDYLKQDSLDAIIAKSKSYGVEKFITIGVREDNLQTVIDLANQYNDVFCTQGIHPHDGQYWSNKIQATIENNLKQSKSKIVAIGEIGLDFHYNNSPKKDQIDAFRDQLLLAIKYDLPVVIHSRDAEVETIEMLKKYAPELKRKGVIHSFTSKIELAECALEEGFFLGFNGIITFKSAQEVRDALKIAPLDSIITETDAPFLTPVPYRGVENAPFYLPFIIEAIAEIKNQSINDVLNKTYDNAKHLFDI